MTDVLVGWSGFVGQSLLRQRPFDRRFRSTDIAEARGLEAELLVCAGAPAQKWVADREPEADRARLQGLAEHLDHVQARRVVLISTVDVFADSRGADEDSDPDAQAPGAYGANRRWLERWVLGRFPGALIVRLPGLVGPGLRKNAIFDLRNDNNLSAIDARGVYQFYPMVNLWADLRTALEAELTVLHLTAEPVSVAEVAEAGFGRPFDNRVEGRTPPAYDLQSRHAALFGGAGAYQYSRRDSLLAIRAYAQSEPPAQPPNATTGA
ncbi:pyridine nucleotide transhydrogenase [Phenylobacterium sp. J426]|uniref:pyridine nucleotide transhydrogenase n=1 Tax=Phenylobacterium sp. J426 TaxID=2898439 RepID=UPI0021507309|nr:pyridine nucleotide transhydrogenase [Phenylobacterium sp. J426]MCR5876317.1 pyridine nucleotide transhydrogenase [Phenylobacterium sp. J426]